MRLNGTKPRREFYLSERVLTDTEISHIMVSQTFLKSVELKDFDLSPWNRFIFPQSYKLFEASIFCVYYAPELQIGKFSGNFLRKSECPNRKLLYTRLCPNVRKAALVITK